MRSRVAFRLLLHDRSSTSGALLGVVAIVFLVGQQLSILFGLLQYMSVLVDHSGADAWITSAAIRNVDATNLISARFLDRIIGLPEVDWAEPILLANGLMRTADGSFEAVRLVGLRRPRLIGGPWAFFKGAGADLIDLEAVAVDRLDLGKFGHPVISFLTEISGRRSRIQAVTQGARAFQGTLIFTSLDQVKDIAQTPPGRYSATLVRFRPGTDLLHTMARLRTLLPECSVLTTSELARLTQYYYLTNTGIGGSFGFSTSIAVLIGIVIITLTMYASVLSRTRDFAVMRALGGRRRDIAVLVISQALMLGGAGIFLGFLLLAALLRVTHGTDIPSYLPSMVPPILALVTMLVSLLGSLVALRKALQADPASVFH